MDVFESMVKNPFNYRWNVGVEGEESVKNDSGFWLQQLDG